MLAAVLYCNCRLSCFGEFDQVLQCRSKRLAHILDVVAMLDLSRAVFVMMIRHNLLWAHVYDVL
jgi:hypothetical protein